MMSPPLLFLAYASNASVPFTAGKLIDLLSLARAKNEPAAITGMLLHRGGNFLQALEGSPAAVRETFARISRDRRHHGVGLLLEEERDERLFADWTMAFEEVSDLDMDAHPGASRYLMRNDGGAAAPSAADDHDVFEFFRSFRENMR